MWSQSPSNRCAARKGGAGEGSRINCETSVGLLRKLEEGRLEKRFFLRSSHDERQRKWKNAASPVDGDEKVDADVEAEEMDLSD